MRLLFSWWPNCTGIGTTTELPPEKGFTSVFICFYIYIENFDCSMDHVPILHSRWTVQPRRATRERHWRFPGPQRRRPVQRHSMGHHWHSDLCAKHGAFYRHVVSQSANGDAAEFGLCSDEARDERNEWIAYWCTVRFLLGFRWVVTEWFFWQGPERHGQDY
jgi:hypothetical protein